MAEIHDIRQKRLKSVLKERFDGVQKDLADALHRDPNYISRVLSSNDNRKNIGEAFAREIENILRLEAGWLDRDGYSDGPTTTTHRVAEARTMRVWDMDVTEEVVAFATEWNKLREPLRTKIQTMVMSLVAEQKRGDRLKMPAERRLRTHEKAADA